MSVGQGGHRFAHPLRFVVLAVVFISPRVVWSQTAVPNRASSTANSSELDSVHISGDEEPRLPAPVKPLRAYVDLVLVPAVVTDASDRPVTNLKKDNFALYEDNELQQIQGFYKEDAPISVGVILDFSNSMSDKFEAERTAVTSFFKHANPRDDYFVIGFSDRPHLIADSTQSIDELRQKMTLAMPSGNTSLLDAIYVAVKKMNGAQYQRRALLIISDGGDNHSYYNPKQIKALAEEANVTMYSIGIFDNMPVPVFKTIEEKLGKRLLTQITELTGGRTIAADDRDKIPEIAADISRELRQQYVLAYKPTNSRHDGKWRKIKLRVTASANSDPLRVYSKKGYIASAD